MTFDDLLSGDISAAANELRARDEPFAFATIIRTVGTTAAKPGAKALVRADGTIEQGFLGGGCTRGAVKRAALKAFETGAPELISVAPEEELTKQGVAPGEHQSGVTYARNGCPSKGTVDIFIEPCLPMPELVVLGQSPVAQALARLAPQFHWAVTVDADGEALAATNRQRFIVVATQGQGDMDALKQALGAQAEYVAFVGSAKKFAALSGKLLADGVSPDRLDAVSAPAGLNIGAVTPEEIALSILAELTQLRRKSVDRGANV